MPNTEAESFFQLLQLQIPSELKPTDFCQAIKARSFLPLNVLSICEPVT